MPRSTSNISTPQGSRSRRSTRNASFADAFAHVDVPDAVRADALALAATVSPAPTQQQQRSPISRSSSISRTNRVGVATATPIATAIAADTMATATATHPAVAAGTIAATAAMQESLLHGRMDLLIGAVRQQQEENRKNNTQLAYDPKKEEWYQFCYHSYGNSIGATTVLPERLFRFLFYQAFRSRRSRGKKSPYNIIEEYSTHFRNGQSIPDPPDPVSFQTLSTYRASVRSIWEEQSAASANSLSWDQVYKKPCRDLFKAVQSRSTRVARIRFDEKIDGEFSTFTTLVQVGNIEAQLFSNGTQTQKDALPSLRNRFVF
jgi:hypothetical protein